MKVRFDEDEMWPCYYISDDGKYEIELTEDELDFFKAAEIVFNNAHDIIYEKIQKVKREN